MFVGLNFVYTIAAFCVAFFQIHDNQLSSLPDSIGELEQLQKLILRYWWRQHYVQSNISTYFECKTCVIIPGPLCSHNKLTELPSGLWRLTNLQCLHLQQNLIEQIPQDLGQLVNLDDLVSDSDLVLTSNKLLTFQQPRSSDGSNIFHLTYIRTRVQKMCVCGCGCGCGCGGGGG